MSELRNFSPPTQNYPQKAFVLELEITQTLLVQFDFYVIIQPVFKMYLY